ncbi:uncharacterized protein LOC131938153 [Physella acuta]|uniref:uncharacterized protein LOC131938153 n=1 Tax=Physella acuta TaxID=109671 RepID=UPI0027DC4A59|nr:uncharacterized protein LOC131938153 [Physella acuta]XP_059152053.1 uncharacterized protein LOC131938153 [Physella acuta]
MSEGNSRLFFVGRSGNGVTSTITSFLSENNQVPGKSKLYQIYKDDVFVAVDGSGIGDGGEDMKHSDEDVWQSIKSILEEIGEDFEALICVFKYGVRFTKQEKDSVDKVKDYFGENIFKERGIIVLTYGDNFDLGNNQSFEEWCNVQRGVFNELLSTCNGRIVLFDNRTKDVIQVNKQREQLKKAVESLRTTKPDRFSSVPALSHEQAVENLTPDIKSTIPVPLYEQAVGLYPTLPPGNTQEYSVTPSKPGQADVTTNDGDQISNSSQQILLPKSEPSSGADGGFHEVAGMAETSHVNTDVQEESQTRFEGQRDPLQAMLVEIKAGNRRILWFLSIAMFVICGIGAVICLKLFHVI